MDADADADDVPPPGSDQIRPGRSGQVPLIKPVRRQVSIEQAWFGLVWFGRLLVVLAGGNKQAIAASSPHTQLVRLSADGCVWLWFWQVSGASWLVLVEI